MSLVDQQSRTDPATRVSELLEIYAGPEASAAGLLCDRHPAEAHAYQVVGRDLSIQRLSYGELRTQSERFAAGLAELGVRPGDRVATLLGKSVEQLVALLGIWRAGAVQVPLFTAFAPPAVAMRLTASRAKVVLVDADQRPKLAREGPPEWRIVVVGGAGEPGDEDFAELMARQDKGFPAARLGGDAPLLHVFTSGTTGKPKALEVPVRALASFHCYMEFGLDVRPEDTFWNAADPGWSYGLYYGILGSFCTGVPSVLLRGGFSAELTFDVLSKLDVTNFAAAPTVYRSLRAAGPTTPRRLRLRAASAAGEPLTPEVNDWAREALGVPVHDHYGQTETGMLVNNHHHPALRRPLRSGSMGASMPGWTTVVLEEDADKRAAPEVAGRIACDVPASPLAWFRGYLDEPEKSREKFSEDKRWYLTGDSGYVDSDGYYRFVSRDDDIILMAGYRIGPFDVESVLVLHPDVGEAAVIAAPDEIRGEVLEAYVVLRDGRSASEELERELQQLVKTKYSAHAYPRRVHFVSELPKTPSGKIKRYVLRQRRRDGAGE
ncbi:AMP-binding protein [Amycolatopsis acidicola]|uniref:AMP-binding protein n=1 Tax=Amycolatopsis acidicola TaxID=2596893 RepID=A0A5N0UM43_9PSEU|nr:AMP-binding protein [Amycolatopsis acidicola]KAA9151104.1 AMP-binding protein [Amycolatopsis acidicola]